MAMTVEKRGKEALLVECGAAVSFSICHDRAKQECPNVFRLSRNWTFRPLDLRVSQLPLNA